MAAEVKVESGADREAILPAEIESLIRRALEEDVGAGDATTNSIVSESARLEALIKAKQHGVVSGLAVAAAVFRTLDENVTFDAAVADGSSVESGTTVATIHGSARSILTAERTALNFLGRMSGIATLTRQFVECVAGTSARILDTRKTAPGLRAIDKLAVRNGGGHNHRFGLYDMILIKDNHIDHAGSLTRAVELARSAGTELEIEVEARTLKHVADAIALGVTRILLDNMSAKMMVEAVKLSRGRAQLEASGNVNLATVRRIAETGVDFISVGELTHSARVFDFSLIVK
ncbi:MAG TPA: carboxylating nicotinate-nucleotide diphosphorylase [Pyrinomonadaceae bacterium]|nr:carboxylating nicotinate-nucleotide diphosphorylase [Pyrinomonadaceae bacterium]